MNITFDPIKEVKNIKKHGVSLQKARHLEWDFSLAWEDDRYTYGEMRMIALVPQGEVLYCVVYTNEGDDTLHIISLRKAEKKEIRRYVSNY